MKKTLEEFNEFISEFLDENTEVHARLEIVDEKADYAALISVIITK